MKVKGGVIVFWLALMALESAPASAQSEAEVRKEFWPEIDVFVKLNDKFRVFILGTVSRAREHSAIIGDPPYEGTIGVHVDYILSNRFFLRAGYRHIGSLNNADPSLEHRLILEQTLRKMLPARILLSDRNRQDFRFVNDDYSFRYRNRVTLEREIVIKERGLTPYVSGEVFYDSRFNTWNRQRYALGVQIPLKKGLLSSLLHGRQVVLDSYFMRQNDSRSSNHHVNAVGLTLQISF